MNMNSGSATKAVPVTSSRKSSHARGYGRLFSAGLAIAALWTQLAYELQKAAARPETYAHNPTTVIDNFWNTFTYLSTAVMALVLIASGITALRGKQEPLWLSIVFTAAAAKTFFVGIFFNIALRWTVPDNAITWINETLHVTLPLYALIDAMLSTHRRVPISAMSSTALLGVGWTISTQIRGPLTINLTTGEPKWYPYDFVNPGLVPGSTIGATAISLALTEVITGIGFLFALFIRHVRARPEGQR